MRGLLICICAYNPVITCLRSALWERELHSAKKEIEKQCSNNGQQRTAEVAHRFCNPFALHQRFYLGKCLIGTGVIIFVARVGISVIGNRTCAGIGDDFVRLSIAVEINLIQAAVNDEDRTVVMRTKEHHQNNLQQNLRWKIYCVRLWLQKPHYSMLSGHTAAFCRLFSWESVRKSAESSST